MAPVDKYLRKLLFEFDCVIIPDFGGLLTHHLGVRYDEEAGIFRPAGKRLAFNEILKIDDGLLVYYLAVGEQISREQATELTRKYVATLRTDLENKRLTSIDKIGNFSTNSEGKLIFEPDYSQNYDQNWYGLQEVKAERSEQQPNWLRQETAIVQNSEILVDFEDSTVPQNDRNNLRWGWAAAAILLCAVSAASYLYEPTEKSLLSSLNPVSLVSDLYQTTHGVSTAGYQHSSAISHSNVAYFQEVKPKLSPLPEDISNVMNEDLITAEQDSIDEKHTVVVQPEPSYHLIAGSFGSQKNARILKSQLISLGFDDARVLKDTPGKWVKVSAGSYQSHSDADKHRSKVDRLLRAESWVYHRE